MPKIPGQAFRVLMIGGGGSGGIDKGGGSGYVQIIHPMYLNAGVSLSIQKILLRALAALQEAGGVITSRC